MSRINKVAQHIVGSSPLAEFLSAANKERIDSILLLGYKTVGRGTEPEFPVSQEEIIRILNNTEWNTYNQPNISVDTAFLNQYDLSDIVDSVYYTTREGEFSCYIDAVEKTIAPSSYVSKDQHVPLPDPSAVKNIFKDF